MDKPHLCRKYAIPLALFFVFTFGDTKAHASDLWARYIQTTDAPPGDKYFPGDEIHVSYGVYNVVGSGSADFSVSFYLAKGGTIDGAAHLLGTLHHDGLAAWEVTHWTTTFTVSESIPNGQYNIAMTVFCPGDTNINNNGEIGSTVCVGTPTADLTVQSVDAEDGSYRAGDEIVVRVDVKNIGQRDSGGHGVDCFASTDKDGKANRYSMGSAGWDSIKPGEKATSTTVHRFPADMPDGHYYIFVMVTCGADNDLRDNEGFDGSSVWVGPFPDPAVLSVHVVQGTYQPGDPVAVRTVVKNVGDKQSDECLVRYYVSTDATITGGDYSMGQVVAGRLAPGEERSQDIACSFPPYVPAGACYVGAILTCRNDGRLQNNSRCDDAAVTVVHPAGYVCGQATYDDTSGWNHPIRYAVVRVYGVDGNNDPTDDRVLGETYTDGDGNYGVRLTPQAAGGPEVYVKVLTQGVSGACPGTTSKICVVKDHVLKQLYSLRSVNYPYPSAGSVTIPLLSLRTAGEFMVYDSVVEGFEKARQFFGVELGEIPAYWPTSDGGTYYVPGEGIFVSKDDRGDRDVIMHEYGHFLADSCGFALGSVGQDPIHYWNLDLRIRPTNRNNKEARNLAFREAWATLFGVATLFGDSGYPYVGDSKYQDVDEITRKAIVVDLEGDTAAHKSPGEYYEHMNCCALWDIFDDNCDSVDNNDTLCDPKLARIWALMAEFKPNDILDFWNAWFTKPQDIKEFNRIIWDHGMTFKAPIPTPTIETFETGNFSAFPWTPSSPFWVVTSGAGRQGSYGAKAATIGNSQSTTLEITLECDDGWIYFWVKTSSEQPWDALRFSIDGASKGEWAGETNWTRVGFPVTHGKRRFTWTYSKDTGASQGADTAWIDDIELPIW